MSYTVQIDVVPEDKEFSDEPLPEGKYLATILPTNKDGSVIVKRPFAKQGANASITALAIRLKIEAGQPGAGRNLFDDVPLSAKFAPSAKHPDGAPCLAFFGLFRALGHEFSLGTPFTLPPDHEIMGRQVEIVVGTDVSGDKPRSRVQFYNKANGIPADGPKIGAPRPVQAGRPAGAPVAGAVPQQAWSPSAMPAAAPVAAAPAAAAWTPAPADVAYANSGVVPAAEQVTAQAAAGWTPGAGVPAGGF